MNDNVRRKLERGERILQYMTDNAASFAGGPGEDATIALQSILAEMHDKAAKEVSGTGSTAMEVSNQMDLFDTLLGYIKRINLAANAMVDLHPGFDTKFRMPRNRAQHILLATAKSFHDDALPAVADFTTYGVNAAMLTELQNTITAIEAASDSEDSASQARSEAVGGLTDDAKRLQALTRQINSVVRIKFFDEPAKISGWTVASHLDKAPKHTPPSPTP